MTQYHVTGILTDEAVPELEGAQIGDNVDLDLSPEREAQLINSAILEPVEWKQQQPEPEEPQEVGPIPVPPQPEPAPEPPPAEPAYEPEPPPESDLQL